MRDIRSWCNEGLQVAYQLQRAFRVGKNVPNMSISLLPSILQFRRQMAPGSTYFPTRSSVWLTVPDLKMAPQASHSTRPHHGLVFQLFCEQHGPGDISSCRHCSESLPIHLLVRRTDDDVIALNVQPLGHTTSSDETFATASRWLAACVALQNSFVPDTVSSQSRPLRFIEIDQSSSGTQLHCALRLKDSSSIADGIPYATLSYCWGKGKAPWKTRLANLASRKVSLAQVALPKTIQDALTVALKLNVAYLWIDCLCIVQDDENEWRSESAKMGDIYKAGLFSIASHTISSHAGCFNKRSQPQLNYVVRILERRGPRSISIPKTHQEAQQSGLIIYTNDPRKTRSSHQSVLGKSYGLNKTLVPWPTLVTEGHLLSRAWVCQERFLAPRILHYTETQLFWQCDHCLLAEDGLPVLGSDEDETVSGSQGAMRQIIRGLANYNVTTAISSKDSAWLWYKALIENSYSPCHLTKKTDKLIAISGLAKIFAEYRPTSRYLAGLWEDELHLGLHWRMKLWMYEIRNHRSEPEVYRAPSWSWASHDGAVEFFGDKSFPSTTYQIAIDNCIVEHQGRDPYGGLKGAWLRVSAKLMADICCLNSHPLDPWRIILKSLGRKNDRYHVSLDYIDDHDWLPRRMQDLAQKLRSTRFFQDIPSATVPWNVLCMLLLLHDRRLLADNESSQEVHRNSFASMLLIRPSKRLPQYYERIGIAWTWDQEIVTELRLRFEAISPKTITLI